MNAPPTNDLTISTHRWLLLFAVLHVMVWTLLPTLLYHNAPLDVIEGLAWGQQWAWGYDKHPWLAPWLTELASLVGGHAVWTIYLLSQLAVLICGLATWRLACTFFPAAHATIAVLLLEGIYYYHFTTPEFNPNVAMLPLWALSILAFYRALQSQRLLTWLVVGLTAGLAMMAKYFSAVLLISQLLFLLLQPTARHSLRHAGPYLALVVFLLVIAPNIIWLSQHDFISLHYAVNRTAQEAVPSGWTHLLHPLQFAVAQSLALAPVLLAFIPGFWGEKTSLPLTTYNRQFLYCMGVMPFVGVLLLSLVTGMELRSMYGTPLFSLIGLILIERVQPALTPKQFYAVLRNITVIFVLFVVVFIGSVLGKPYLTGEAKRVNFPGPELAVRLTQQWRQHYALPLRYVAGDRWLAGNVAFYSPDRPVAYFDWNPTVSFWINEQQLRQTGAVFLWDAQEQGTQLPVALAARFPTATTLPVQYFASPIAPHKVLPIAIGVAFLPPQSKD